MEKDFLVEAAWINQVIRGKIQFRKCPNCDIEGVELQHWSPDSGEKCGSEEDGAYREACQDCDGIGFIEIPS